MMYTPPNLPIDYEIETKAVMKRTALARSALAEMKGAALSIPNETILISTLSLQEAKESSAIENIITTHDELFQADYLKRQFATISQALQAHFDSNPGSEELRSTDAYRLKT